MILHFQQYLGRRACHSHSKENVEEKAVTILKQDIIFERNQQSKCVHFPNKFRIRRLIR